MEHSLLTDVFEKMAFSIDIVSITVMFWGFLLSTVNFFKWEASKLTGKESVVSAQMIRCKLGAYILIGLEFMIISDIISTIISHSLEQLVFLSAIIVIRTIMAFFLEKELEYLKV